MGSSDKKKREKKKDFNVRIHPLKTSTLTTKLTIVSFRKPSSK